MKFGRFLQEKSKPEWRLYYVDYAYLKLLIKGMKKAIKDGSQTKKEAEHKFTKTIDLEINKVNEFFLMVEKEIQAKLLALRQLLNKNIVESKNDALTGEIELLSNLLTDLYEYTLVNFTAFRKILKKHDRHTEMVASPWFIARCKQQPFYSSSKKFGNMLVKFSNCCSKVRAIMRRDEERDDHIPVDDGYSSIPSSTRFWIRHEDVMRVKTIVVKHLPVHMPTSSAIRFPKDFTDSVHINSTYYDNAETMESYESRLRRIEGATAIRFRRYELSDLIYVERKTHHSNFSGSIRERIMLNPTDVFDFVRGTYKLEDFLSYLEQQDQPEESVKESCRLFSEIQSEILQRKFVPVLTTTYHRATFQHPDDTSVKISIDTNVHMIKDNLRLQSDGKWCKSDLQVSEDDVHEFPYAILELKLHPNKPQPDWVSELMNGELVRLALNYSKFTHGCALLLRDKITSTPDWLPEFQEEKDKEKKDKKEKQNDYDIEELSEKQEDVKLGDIWEEKNSKESDNLIEMDSEDALRHRNRLISSSRENVRRVLSERKPSLWKRLREMFDFDSHFVKDGKPIVNRMKVEPKTYFANERTFLQWMSFCVVIQGIGAALVSFPGTSFVGITSGVCFVIISILFMGYALFMFRWRAARIRNNQPGRYDDHIGPSALFVVMLAAVLLNSIMFVSSQLNTISEYQASEGFNS